MKKIIAVGVVASAALLVASVASVSALSGSGANAPITPTANILDLPVFQAQPARSTVMVNSLSQLQSQAGSYDKSSIPAHADYSKAVPVAVPGTASKFLWITPTSSGDICGFVPQFAGGNLGGFSSVCSTLADFNTSGLLVLNNGPNGKYLTVSVQPSGAPVPVVTASNGDKRDLQTKSGVAVATLDSGDSVSVRGNTFSTNDLDQLQDPSKVLGK